MTIMPLDTPDSPPDLLLHAQSLEQALAQAETDVARLQIRDAAQVAQVVSLAMQLGPMARRFCIVLHRAEREIAKAHPAMPRQEAGRHSQRVVIGQVSRVGAGVGDKLLERVRSAHAYITDEEFEDMITRGEGTDELLTRKSLVTLGQRNRRSGQGATPSDHSAPAAPQAHDPELGQDPPSPPEGTVPAGQGPSPMPVEAPLGLGLPAAPDPGDRAISERGAVPPPAETGRAAVDPAVQAVVRAIAPDLNPMEGGAGASRFFILGRDDPDTVTSQLEEAMDGGGVELAIILAAAATGVPWALILSRCAALAWLPDREDTREPGPGLLIGGPAANRELVMRFAEACRELSLGPVWVPYDAMEPLGVNLRLF